MWLIPREPFLRAHFQADIIRIHRGGAEASDSPGHHRLVQGSRHVQEKFVNFYMNV